MPKMDGLQLLRALRANGPTSKVGFILVTGSGDKGLILEGKKLGLNNYLPKPFDANSLRSCIEAVVGKLS
jgi:two-component system chemotaxis response regulator CheY